ncbi:MAG: hypothetical protein ACO3DJ_00820 [Alphaproteobacteria bacterium]|jgi:hypothetical protein
MTRADILARLRAAGIEPGEGDLAHYEATLPALEAATRAVRDALARMASEAPERPPSPPRS